MKKQAIRVLIVDDEELVRRGFTALIDAEPGFETVGEARDGAEAIERIRSTRPDVVLMDIRMATLDGIAATRRIVHDDTLAASRVLILTTFDLDQYVYDALRAGASGFLLKDTAPQQLLDAIQVVASGGRSHRSVDHEEAYLRVRCAAQSLRRDQPT